MTSNSRADVCSAFGHDPDCAAPSGDYFFEAMKHTRNKTKSASNKEDGKYRVDPDSEVMPHRRAPGSSETGGRDPDGPDAKPVDVIEGGAEHAADEIGRGAREKNEPAERRR